MKSGIDYAQFERKIRTLLRQELVGKDAEMLKAWVFQYKKDVARLGKNAPWYCGWYEPGRKRRCINCGPGALGKRLAKQKRDDIHSQLVQGTYGTNLEKTWAEFQAEYIQKILAGRARKTREQALMSFQNFDRICKPALVNRIDTKTVDHFISIRQAEKVWYSKDKHVSAASVNADLRNVRAAIEVAKDWGYIKEIPKFRLLKEPKRIPVYITPSDFEKLYQACTAATLPRANAALWWRCLLITGYLTGWRIGEILSLKPSEIDWTNGTVVLWNQKAKREDIIPVHSLVMDHWRKLPLDNPKLFHWPHHEISLYDHLYRICRTAGTKRYSFHALRKAFCSVNSDLPPVVLQQLARHQDFATTRRHYIDATAKLRATVDRLQIPRLAM